MKKSVFFKLIFLTFLVVFLFSLTSCDFYEALLEVTDEDYSSPSATLYFNTMGGYMPEGAKTYKKYDKGASVNMPPSPEKHGYTFKGWVLENGEAAAFPFTIDKNVTLTASWEEIPDTVTITYKLNGGSFPVGTNDTFILEVGSKLDSFPTPKKQYFEFMGWLIDGKPVTFPFVVDTDVTVTAKWEQIEAGPPVDLTPPNENTAIIVFDTGEGVLANGAESPALYTIGKKIFALPSAYREGYTFLGWEIGDSPVVLPFEVTKSAVLEAIWEKNPDQITVSFDANGGELPKGSASYKNVVGQTLESLPTPTRPLYNFVGWYLDGDETKPIDKRSVALDSDMVLVALWEKAGESVFVEFYCENGTTLNVNSSVLEMLEGDRLSFYLKALPVASRYGCGFLGWYDSDGNHITLTSFIYKDTILYPSWKELNLCSDGTENHQWAVWQETSTLSCSTPLQNSRICNACGYTEYETITEALGHNFGTWTTTTSNSQAVRERTCLRCDEKEIDPLKNITYETFRTPIVDGDCWGADKADSLLNGDYTDTPIAGKGTGAMTISLEAKRATYVDVFTVTGHGSSSYTVTVYYADGTSRNIGLGSFGSGDSATKAFTVGATITKIVIHMSNPSNGSDFWSELTAFVINE